MSDEDKAQTTAEEPSEPETHSALPQEQQDSDADRAVAHEMGRRTRRSFLVGAGATLAALGGWHWLGTRREADGIPWPLRRAHEINGELSRDYFKSARLAPTFPQSMAHEPRVNGLEGMDEGFDPQSWKLTVIGLANPPDTSTNHASGKTTDSGNAKDSPSDDNAGGQDDSSDEVADEGDEIEGAATFTLEDIKQLPRVEMVTEHKCIEGWSVIVRWAGARFADFAAMFPPLTRSGDAPDVLHKPDALVRYVGIETPGGGYYVGLEMESALHPQTLLCYEMNGQPLTLEHGAPLRLVTPLKYGIKSIKRIGKISYTDKRPADFWAEQGYDWYSSH